MGKPPNTGWKLSGEQRAELLCRFPPRYERTIADHVTQRLPGGGPAPVPGPVEAKVIGRADDGDSLECLVVAVDGSPDRPDGSTYHITWSLGPGRTAKESNDVLRDGGWQPIDEAVPLDLMPARF